MSSGFFFDWIRLSLTHCLRRDLGDTKDRNQHQGFASTHPKVQPKWTWVQTVVYRPQCMVRSTILTVGGNDPVSHWSCSKSSVDMLRGRMENHYSGFRGSMALAPQEDF